MKEQYIKNYCNAPYCTNWIGVIWNGEFIEKYYCPKQIKQNNERRKKLKNDKLPTRSLST